MSDASGSQSSSHASLAYRPDIDGLRALAVAVVVAFHAFPRLLPGGFVGVDVFFVISGFLISGIIFGAQARGEFTFRDFYRRRIARIFPALAVVTAASLVIGWAVLIALDYRRLGNNASAAGVFGANVAFWLESGYFDVAAARKPLLHLWSLGVEEQFYLVWPPLLVLAARRRWNAGVVIGVVGLASLAISLFTTRSNADAAFFLPFARMWELALGAFLAWRHQQGRASLAVNANVMSGGGVALIVAACLFLNSADLFPGWLALIPVAGAALVVLAGPGAWINARILSLRPVVFVGLISYPLYLWHWPLLAFARGRSPDELDVAQRLALVVVGAALAWATYEWVERPIRHGRFARATWRTPVLVAALMLVTVAGLGVGAGRLPTRLDLAYPQLSRFAFDYRSEYRSNICQLAERSVGRRIADVCVDSSFGRRGVPSVLLLGDSHAAHLYPGLRALAAERGLALAQYTAAGCTPAPGPPAAACQFVDRVALDFIAARKPTVLVIASAWHEVDVAELTAMIASARSGAPTARIVVVGPVPQWVEPLPLVILRHLQQHPGAQVPRYLNEGLLGEPANNDVRLRLALANQPVTYLSAQSVLCGPAGCLATVDGAPIAWDAAHLTPSGSRLMARAILDSVR
jgi:peptidoglycan/LPS O-acetylase OafA/YrhL